MISQGLSLGGTSNLDYMIYLRGSPQDYDNWAEVTGDPSWSYNSVMDYFKKHENYDGLWKDPSISFIKLIFTLLLLIKMLINDLII